MGGANLVQKIIRSHRLSGGWETGHEVEVRVDHILTRDAEAPFVFLLFESMRLPATRVPFALACVDQALLQTTPEDADVHRFVQTASARFGVHFSRPGNGVSQQVYLERFAIPGGILLGADSHVQSAGGAGVLALAARKLEVAVAMGSGAHALAAAKVVGVRLHGRLRPWVSAADVGFELLRRLTVSGGHGRIFEYCGEGTASLTVPQRAVIAGAGAAMGAVGSIFPSDARTKAHLAAQGRSRDWTALAPDADAAYDEYVDVDLDKLEPMAAKPHSPDNVCLIKEIEGTKVNQVVVGTCAHASYEDLMEVAQALDGKRAHPEVSLVVAPGSRQVLERLSAGGGLRTFLSAGARVLEPGCGPCSGLGQVPPSRGVSLRTCHSNFSGSAGSADAMVYLASPAVAAATALSGLISDPRALGKAPRAAAGGAQDADGLGVVPPPEDPGKVELARGAQIKPLPLFPPMDRVLRGTILHKMGHSVATEQILASAEARGARRHNAAAAAEHLFEALDATLAKRAKDAGGGFLAAGESYGEGPTGDLEAMACRLLGIRAILARSFAPEHLKDLARYGVAPLAFADARGYDAVSSGDLLEIKDLPQSLKKGKPFAIRNLTRGSVVAVACPLDERHLEILIAGGILNRARELPAAGRRSPARAQAAGARSRSRRR